jgi:hypothetical protein
MRVRDAVEEDGEVLGELADAPAEVMRNVVHDRTVRVAERPPSGDGTQSTEPSDANAGDGDSEEAESDDVEADEAESANGETGDDDESDDGETGDDDESDDAENAAVVGFVGFDAKPGTVRVTYLRGTPEARERLLEEPVRFARKEGMAVEALVPESEAETKEVVEAAGFRRSGTGPRFEGGQTLEYRLEPSGRADSTRR